MEAIDQPCSAAMLGAPQSSAPSSYGVCHLLSKWNQKYCSNRNAALHICHRQGEDG